MHKQKPPITDIPSPHKKKGTTSFHVENGGVATTRKYKLSDDFSDRTKKNEEQPQNTPKIAPIFDKNVTIVLSGLVDKKCGWVFYKHRQLILNSKPRLMYYDPETNQLRVKSISIFYNFQGRNCSPSRNKGLPRIKD